MNRVLKILRNILLFLLSAALALVLLVWGGLNIAKYAIYPDYYAAKSNICTNPGLNDGFICQGIAVDEPSGEIIVSGYMMDHSASRLYVTDRDNHAYYVSLTTNGSPYTGHAGGVAVHGDTAYISNGSKLFVFSAADVLSAKNGDVVDIGPGVPLNNKASFVFADERYVYVGEFSYGSAYVTHHPYDTPAGRQTAILSRYAHDDLSAPDKVYSIRDKVQGMCMTDDGRIVLSTSHSISDSVFYVYNDSDAIDSGLTLDGAPVYYLTAPVREIKGPAMAECLDFSGGKIVTLFESASDKYIFGKFFFADKIVALDL